MSALDDSLIEAVTSGNTVKTARLLREGANPDARQFLTLRDRRPVLLLAIGLQRVDLVQTLLKYRANPDIGYVHLPLLYAAEFSTPEMVEALVKGGADTALLNRDGETALIVAARKGRLEVVKKLCDLGLCVDQPDSDGWSAIMHAIKEQFASVAAYLKKMGASLSRPDFQGVTGFELVRRSPVPNLARTLRLASA